MALHCTTTFTCDRNHGVTGVSEGDAIQSNPPQNWARINYDRMVGVSMKTTIAYLCPACADELVTFMETVPSES